MAQIFLSYARENADPARQLAADLAEAGHEVWWDDHLRGGSRFITEIQHALKAADAVVVLWSPASVESAWVQDEAAEGRDSGRLIPIAIGSAAPPLGFRQFHTIDFGAWDGGGRAPALPELLQAIERMCPSQPAQSEAAGLAAQANGGGKACVCVLPFVNMSGEPEQEYFSDGITEDIITDLSKISALSVIARNTAFSFKGKAVDVREVVRAIGVSHVLEGSVRKAAGRVRITAQLIDGARGDHVWAERYDRELTDIFAIQDEISQAIVGALRLRLLPDEKKAIVNRGTASVDAYNLYLMARKEWVSGSYGSLRRDQAIVRICSQATVIDPNYAQAWALMALAQAELRFWHGHDENAMPAAERALALNPDLAEPHCVIARYREEESPAEAVKEIEEALRLDPESWEVNREAARLIFRQGRLEESIPFFEKAAALTDSDWHNPAMLFACYRKTGDEKNLRRVMKLVLERTERALADDPTNGSAIAMGVGALAYNGEKERAREWIQRGLLLDPGNLSMLYNMACSLVMELHDYDAALDMLREFFERTTTAHIRHMEVDPDFEPLRDMPPFQEMMATAKARLGMTADQGAATTSESVRPASPQR